MGNFKTICFQTNGEVNRFFGGLDRVTEILSDFFEKKGYTVYYLSLIKRTNTTNNKQYYLPNDKDLKSDENVNFYNKFIKDKNIDVLINQEGNVDIILPLDNENKKSLIYITVLHFNPNYITNFHFTHRISRMEIPSLLKKALTFFAEISFVREAGLQYLRKKLEYNYYKNCSHCDSFVLLSTKFEKDMKKLFKTRKYPNNITAINNPIKYNRIKIDLSKKQKKILYVGRLECGMKQINLLLTNWKIIANEHPEWSFHLVGSGPDESLLKEQVIEESIPRVVFEGVRNPLKFYEEASIFCFSSASSEGWGMVLVEAQAYGCVPIAFESYSSITDIITDKVNGRLVAPYDSELYRNALSELITKEELRNILALESVESVKKFDIDRIGEQWITLIKNIAKTKK